MKRCVSIAILLVEEFGAALLLLLFFASIALSAHAQDVTMIDAGNAAAYTAWLAATGTREVIVRGSTPEATARLTAVLALGTTMAAPMVPTAQPRAAARGIVLLSATPPTYQFFRTITIATPAPPPPPPPPPPPNWSVLPKITVPWSSATQSGWRPAFTVDMDSLRSDLDTAARWADGANAACACPYYPPGSNSPVGGYEWLRSNPAAIADWRLRSGGQDPVVWLCEQGYDSPLATFTPLFSFNRTVDDAALTEVVVQYNGVNYPATFTQADCLAGCTVTARVPCAGEHQATIIKLSKPGGAPEKCVWRYGAVGGGFKCPSQ